MTRRDEGVGGRLRALFEAQSTRELSDGQLLERFAAGPGDGAERAFSILVERHGPMVLRVARGILADPDSAQDAFQATFLVLIRRARGLWVRDSLGPWLYQVAHRTASCLRADGARRRRLDEAAGAARGRLTGPAPDDDLARILHEEIGRLPERYRAPVVLCDLEGRTHEQAARSLGWPIGTVKSRQARARDRLRDRLARRGVEPGLGLALLRPDLATFAAAASSLTPATVRLAGRLLATRAFDPGPASTLAREVHRSMAITRWIRAATLVALLGIAASGVALVARAHPSPPPEPPPTVTETSPAASEDDRPALIGTVVDEAGRGVPGAEVAGTVWQKPVRATADAAGAFRIAAPAAIEDASRPFGVILARDSTGRVGIERLGGGPREKDGGPVRVVLKPGHDLAVTVRDPQDRPVAGAEVLVLTEMQPIVEGRTDAGGHWSGIIPANLEGWDVLARRGEVGMDYATSEQRSGSETRSVPMPREVALRLDGADPIRVRVVDPTGRPLAGVALGPWTVQKFGRSNSIYTMGLLGRDATTGPDGTARLDWLPARPLGTHSILTTRKGFTVPDNATYVEPHPPGGEVTVTMTPVERLAGLVREADGRPAAGVAVEAHGVGFGQREGRGSARTDAAGHFAMMVDPDQAYVLTATRGEQAAPYRSGVIVHAGRPVDGIDLTLTRATVVAGRVTVGPDARPVSGVGLDLNTAETPFPEDLRRPGRTILGDNTHRAVSARHWAITDATGRYEFRVGPGEYMLVGPSRVEPTRVSIPPADAPSTITVDRRMPRPVMGPLALLVVDAAGRPIPGATVDGRYASFQANRMFERLAVGADGTARTERSLDPIVLRALSPDGKLGGVIRSEAEATEARIALAPLAAATGRLLDSDRRPVPRRKLGYGIRIPMGPAKDAPWTTTYGGSIETDDHGHFRLGNLVPGQCYHVDLPLDEKGSSRGVTNFVATPELHDLGDLAVDTEPFLPYVPPTPR